MMTDDSSRSAETNSAAPSRTWPLAESEIAETEVLLIQIQAMIALMEQTTHRAKTHLAVLMADAPALRLALGRAESEQVVPAMTDLQAARGLRAELVKASQETVAVSQTAAKYLQAREQFLLSRRAWIKRPAS
jgi:hypothetical protein